MAAAATAGAAATGLRAWLAARRPSWLTGRRLRVASAAILTAGILAAGTQLSGGDAPDDPPADQASAAPARPYAFG